MTLCVPSVRRPRPDRYQAATGIALSRAVPDGIGVILGRVVATHTHVHGAERTIPSGSKASTGHAHTASTVDCCAPRPCLRGRVHLGVAASRRFSAVGPVGHFHQIERRPIVEQSHPTRCPIDKRRPDFTSENRIPVWDGNELGKDALERRIGSGQSHLCVAVVANNQHLGCCCQYQTQPQRRQQAALP